MHILYLSQMIEAETLASVSLYVVCLYTSSDLVELCIIHTMK